jgi:hypothetical protein
MLARRAGSSGCCCCCCCWQGPINILLLLLLLLWGVRSTLMQHSSGLRSCLWLPCQQLLRLLLLCLSTSHALLLLLLLLLRLLLLRSGRHLRQAQQDLCLKQWCQGGIWQLLLLLLLLLLGWAWRALVACKHLSGQQTGAFILPRLLCSAARLLLLLMLLLQLLLVLHCCITVRQCQTANRRPAATVAVLRLLFVGGSCGVGWQQLCRAGLWCLLHL